MLRPSFLQLALIVSAGLGTGAGTVATDHDKYAKIITSVAQTLQFVKLEGDLILSLPESNQKKENKKK